MFYVNLLATAPAAQGKGYGSALVASITSEVLLNYCILFNDNDDELQADAHGKSTFLLSSNVKNTGFYNSCGFDIVASASIGDDNPQWKGKPIIVPLVSCLSFYSWLKICIDSPILDGSKAASFV